MSLRRLIDRPLRQKVVALGVTSLLITSTLVSVAHAAVTSPTLKLMAPSEEITMWRYGRGQPVYMDLGFSIGALDAPFELLAQRPDYAGPQTLTQVLYGPGAERELRTLDPALLDGWNGLKEFFSIVFVNADGDTIVDTKMEFCPGGYTRERLNDNGPNIPAYPSGCYSNPFTKGVVWGIDEGWAVASSSVEPPLLDIPNGHYTATVSINQTFVDLFAIAPSDASAQIPVRIRTMTEGGCGRGCGLGTRTNSQSSRQQAQAVPTETSPSQDVLPDLIALPSWGINVENRKTRSLLTFGATVWNGGASDLVVEGFRRDGEAVMDGFQYFYDGDEVVGKAPAGDLIYDDRDGHQHWHFKQFAAYSLLDADGNEVRVSRKEAFCLAPTDAIDMTLPNAEWNPGAIGLYTACGGQSSIWTREILPLGWGDTYFQGLPGQSFYITNLPNGTYFIKVEANPGELLYEQTAANNVELREIVISGPAGKRKVEVPPWNGIDTEEGVGKGRG
ncbi:MAG: hypothetical protein QOG04_1358 [Actinomycetota bacterium]|jgi:hypothetical protein|nr:hypothetical protein [Actinomycetota bacterium]